MMGSLQRHRGLVLAVLACVCLLLPGTAAAQTATVTLPTVPGPEPVMVDPATTAYLVLDISTVICQPRPTCVATLPAIGSFLNEARAQGALVVYSSTPSPGAEIIPDVAPQGDEQTVVSHADKFFNTSLDQILQANGIKTVVIVGTVANGAVLYTSFGAVERGYTVVVAEDGISANSPFDMLMSEYQLLNQPGYANATNQALKAGAVTLSRTDLISFSGGPTGK